MGYIDPLQRLQLWSSGKSHQSRFDKQSGFSVHKPNCIIQDSHMVLDDPSSKQAIKP